MIKVRIAPSPTGNLHVGTARTALFNWLFAKKNKGEFILRIEDTDLERSDKKYEENIIESLKWLGLDWDGGIYRQSERLDVYEKYIRQLLDSGRAFWCCHTKQELEKEQKEQAERKEAPRHVCEHKYKGQETRDKRQGIIRLAVDENSTRIIHFDDEIRGTIEWEERLLGDFSLAKDARIPLYNFAVVVDDIDMSISHVIRGEDHISNTPKQILIYEALQGAQILNSKFQIPIFAHLPLILGPNRTKLSKRYGAMSITEYKNDYLPEALVNFMGFLGYTYSKEIINKKEMVEEFELKKVHKSAAVFNIDKLDWLNSQHIRNLEIEKLRNLTGVMEIPEKALPLITERLEKLSGVQDFDYFWKEPHYESNLLDWPPKASLAKGRKDFSRGEIKKSLEEVAILLHKAPVSKERRLLDKDALRLVLDDLGKKLGDRGLVYWPFRVALTGREKSPDPVEIFAVLGKEKTIKRVKAAIDKIIFQ